MAGGLDEEGVVEHADESVHRKSGIEESGSKRRGERRERDEVRRGAG